MNTRANQILFLVLIGFTLLISGCQRTIGLVPTPIVYQDERIKALWEPEKGVQENSVEIFYATDRKPVGPPDNIQYPNTKGGPLMLGTATMYFGDEDMTWDRLVQLTFSDTRQEYIPVNLGKIVQLGALVPTVSREQAQKHPDLLHTSGQTDFIKQINAALAAAEYKDINIYVHGSIVDFMNPLKVSSGFYHYIGRKGAMIAYAWRTKPGITNYSRDVHRAKQSVPYLVDLIEFLAANTSARRINLISYSAGGPLLGNALVKIREDNPDMDEKQLYEKYRIGTAIFASSDIDLATFSSDMLLRLYDLPKEIIVTLNQNDGTLSITEFLYGASRLGKPKLDELTAEQFEDMAKRMEKKVTVIDVSEALHLRAGGQESGHDYWYRNDWVLTDVLAALIWDLPAEQRALARKKDGYTYHFPPDYPERIVDLILERNVRK